MEDKGPFAHALVCVAAGSDGKRLCLLVFGYGKVYSAFVSVQGFLVLVYHKYGIILVSHSDLNFERLGFSSLLIFLANGDILNSWISVFIDTNPADHEALTWGAC